MIKKAISEKIVVISDLHIGNPFARDPGRALTFIRWAAGQGYDICINGDGLEVAQTSTKKILVLLPEIVRTLQSVRDHGKSIYYVLGNHDVGLEHMLEDWGHLKVATSLDLTSGSSKIKIEHGHLYDPLYSKNPLVYEWLTHLFGVFLRISPQFYKGWIFFERTREKIRKFKTGIIGEPPQFAQAAVEITRQGYDYVIFGHTHQAGEVILENGKKYLNPGSWLFTSHYIEILNGRAELKSWSTQSSIPLPLKPSKV